MELKWRTCFRLGITVFLLYLCTQYWSSAVHLISALWSAAAPLVIGCAVAYLVNILMSFYEKYYFQNSREKWVAPSRRPVCMLAAMLTFVAVVVLVVSLVLPQLFSCISLVFAEIPEAMNALVGWLDTLQIVPEDIVKGLEAIDWQSKVGEIVKTLTSGVGNVVSVVFTAASSVLSAITTALFSLIFSIYLLLGKEKLAGQSKRFLKHYLPEKWYQKIMYVLSILNGCFHRFIVGQCLEAVILGTLCALGMTVLRLPYAAMVGALIAFTALIPVVGAFIGGGVGA
ncbi:MAG: AI-2E family transporter, partial [Lachnospiraceae bacterium]|nr:AI-2E family transporter [Lachnospiraceae bacterium]